MRPNIRKMGHYFTLAVFVLFYSTVFAIWTSKNYHPADSIYQNDLDLNERVPRSIKNKLKANDNKNISIDDIFISVKTTKLFHSTRLDVIIKTWFKLAKNQTYFFTDAEDTEYQRQTGGHLINTNCSSPHNRKALCCKMSVELDTFLETDKKWFCHFDDDNYVNINALIKLLSRYPHTEDWYIGKPSITAPLKITNRDNQQEEILFWFATGGAGFCISRSLGLKMIPFVSGGKFISIGEKIRLPDDVTIGYIIEHLLNKKLTIVDTFHSHFEPLKYLKANTFKDHITFSYSMKVKNVINIKSDIDNKKDPTRFLSLHCHLTRDCLNSL